jgi:hypothetical protein
MCENGKMRHVETILRMGGDRIKESDGGGEFNSDIFVSTFVNIPMYNNNDNKKN